MTGRYQELIEAADMNALLGAVDALCGERAWEELLDLAERCEHALERGKQLWPIAAHIDYRVALEAPAEYAADVLDAVSHRFMLGPLTEVAASTHTWDELAPHIESPQHAAYIAQERVMRGEDLQHDERAHPEDLGIPLKLQAWEPSYALATYRSDHVEIAEPWEPKRRFEKVSASAGPTADDPELVAALLDLVQPWTAESNGAARAVAVEGNAAAAVSALAPTSIRMCPVELDLALQRMAWAAASGGAHGRRRGAALGRFMSWYVVSLAAGTSWPVEPDELAAAGSGLGFYVWDEGEVEKGWVLRVAVEHPADGWSAAIAATDLLEEDED
ncbi:MAG: hypothetical protein ACRDJS_00420 [Actinomycetota bacterium]|jgi:hypothetical protein